MEGDKPIYPPNNFIVGIINLYIGIIIFLPSHRSTEVTRSRKLEKRLLTHHMLKTEYSRTTSIPWLLMAWLLVSPGHQQQWYWLFRINRSLSSMRKDINYQLRPRNGAKDFLFKIIFLCHWTIKIKQQIQSRAIIARSNIVRYCINDFWDSGRISLRCWIHKRHSIPCLNGWAMGCLLWIFLRKLTMLWQYGTVYMILQRIQPVKGQAWAISQVSWMWDDKWHHTCYVKHSQCIPVHSQVRMNLLFNFYDMES